MRRPLRIATFVLAGALAAVALTARAQTEPELAAARQLFAAGVKDEQAGSYPEALRKFQRVQQVRDTQSVRYRIATCFEALGRLREALAAYEAASIVLASDAESAEIARASRAAAAALSKRAARIVVSLSPRAPGDAAVRLDGAPVRPGALGAPVVVDPGAHEITATATGAAPFRSRLVVAEGEQASIEIPLDPPPPVAAPAPSPVAPAAPPAPAQPRGPPLGGILAIAGGGLLLGGAAVVLVVRHADVAALERACPGGVCDPTRRDELESTRSRALVEGPVAVGLGVGGAVLAGLGVYLVASPHERPATVAVAPWIAGSSGGLSLHASF